MAMDWADDFFPEWTVIGDVSRDPGGVTMVRTSGGPITTRADAVLDADFDEPNSKFVHDMTLADYRRGVGVVFDTFRIR